jgi:hypothetical protein
LLSESTTKLPPIIVHRSTMRVIDGMHRLRAAALRGETHIEVKLFDCDDRDAFVVAVKFNVAHGLPLTLADRRNAASRIITSHPWWSDRMIASIVNLAPRTVSAIRACSTEQSTPSNVRLGRDGRVRPVTTAGGRRLAHELLVEKPGASLREIARATGLAPSTVLDVRNRLDAGRDPVPESQRRTDPARRPAMDAGPTDRRSPDTSMLTSTERTTAMRVLRVDPSLRFSEAGRLLLRWLEVGPIDADSRNIVVEHLPQYCANTIATLARGHAEAWLELVEEIEKRAASHGDDALELAH